MSDPFMNKEELEKLGYVEPPYDPTHCNGIEPFDDVDIPAALIPQEPDCEVETWIIRTCDVTTGERRRDGSKWVCYTIGVSNYKMSTFDNKLGAIALANIGVACEIKYKREGSYLNIIDIEPYSHSERRADGEE